MIARDIAHALYTGSRARATVGTLSHFAPPVMDNLERHIADPSLLTFRELDRAHGRTKGEAFRAFKALASQLVEGRDFYCCDRRVDGEAFDLLEASGRLYAGTVNGVLLAPSAQAAIAAHLQLGVAGHSPSA